MEIDRAVPNHQRARRILNVFSIFAVSFYFLGTVKASAAPTLIDEVTVQTHSHPHIFDWRRESLSLELGYLSVQEMNSFHSNGYALSLSTPLAGPWLVRMGVRRVTAGDTASSRQLALTPFSQAAQPSRFEYFAGVGVALLDGRSATPFSPILPDVGHALYGFLDVQYNQFFNNDPEPIAAMRAVRYKYAMDVGLHLHIYLPQSFGLGFEWAYALPLPSVTASDSDLPNWQRLSGSLSWSFGG